MSDLNWDQKRCDQLSSLAEVLVILASAYHRHDFLRKLETISEIARELVYADDSFYEFLRNLSK